MAKTPDYLQQIEDIQEVFNDKTNNVIDTSTLLTPVNGLPTSGSTYRSEITNRASIIDFEQDLRPRLGIERIHTQQIAKVKDEVGPNGEIVFKEVNDTLNRIRFYGPWVNGRTDNGVRIVASGSNEFFIEVVFYGTGLNILWVSNTPGDDLRVTMDGGAESGDLLGSFAAPNPITNRGFSTNQISAVTSGLSLAIHTARFRLLQGNSTGCSGFEIVTEETTLKTNSGASFVDGKKSILTSQDSQAFASSFETGTLGTKGGCVLVYQKSDGTVKKAVTSTDSTQKNLSSADHSNEEVIRTYNWREFGSGRSDDFSTLTTSTSDRTFTLADGTTTLVGEDVKEDSGALSPSSLNDFWVFTFVGTGLDLISLAEGTEDLHDIIIDNTNIGQLENLTDPIVKIVSGLPYGTHTLKLSRPEAVTNAPSYSDFIVYGPKKPTLPSGAVKLSSYYIMADFVANSTQATEALSTGVLRKDNTREINYFNGTGGTTDWTLGGVAPTQIGGHIAVTDRLNAFFEYTFWGTGFDLRFIGSTDRSNDISVTLDGTALTAANFGTASFSTYGAGVSYNSGTGSLDQLTGSALTGCGFVTSGLPLDLYTVKFNNNVASSKLVISAVDIITPIHTHDSLLPVNLQNALPIGNQSLEDLREFNLIENTIVSSNWTQAQGVTSNPTTTSTSKVPLEDLLVTVNVEDEINSFEAVATIVSSESVANEARRFQIHVNSVAVGKEITSRTSNAATDSDSTVIAAFTLARGTHTVQVFWRVGSGTGTAASTNRTLIVKKI